MTSAIAPWQRPAFRHTGRAADFTLIVFADRNVLGPGIELRLLAGGHVVAPGHRLRAGDDRLLAVTTYAPGATTPDLALDDATG